MMMVLQEPNDDGEEDRLRTLGGTVVLMLLLEKIYRVTTSRSIRLMQTDGCRCKPNHLLACLDGCTLSATVPWC